MPDDERIHRLMIVTEQQAADFIEGYTMVMVEIFGPASRESEMNRPGFGGDSDL